MAVWRPEMDNAGTAIKLGGLMTKRLLAVMAGFVLATSVAYADTGDRKDLQVFNDISKAVTRYTHFTVFDNVDAAVKDGVVTLTGQVTMPYKRDDIENRVAKIDGVKQVNDKITVLPVSQFDDQLRYRIARAIYSNPNFWNYAIGPNPPIHIVVNHGHVTLEGVVMNDADRIIAKSIASNQFGVMSIENNLKTDAEAKDALERAF